MYVLVLGKHILHIEALTDTMAKEFICASQLRAEES